VTNLNIMYGIYFFPAPLSLKLFKNVLLTCAVSIANIELQLFLVPTHWGWNSKRASSIFTSLTARLQHTFL